MPPPGLTWEEDFSRRKPYRARWRVAGQQRRPAVSFATPEEREEHARQWLKVRELRGKAAQLVRPERLETWNAFSRITGGADPLEVARWYVRARGSLGGEMLTSEAIDRYLEHRHARNPARDTWNHLRLHLQRLRDALGGNRLRDLTGEMLATWLRTLTTERTKLVSECTRLHHYISSHAMFEHAVRSGWVDRNPLAAVERPDVVPHEEGVGILSIEEGRALFAKNLGQPVIGRIALEAFGGLRASSAARLTAEEIAWEAQGITLPARQHKTRRRFYVDGHPPTLWKFMRAAPQDCWSMSAWMYPHRKGEAFVRANIEEAPHNSLRHSFATYHLAAYKDPGKTAVLMQHRGSPQVLWQHYAGRATEKEGKAWFALAPRP